MIVARTVLNAKWGRGDELVQLFKDAYGQGGQDFEMGKGRILTDLSGKFFRVVLESEHESLAAWEQWRARTFSSPEFQKMFAVTVDLVESGATDFYTIEAEVG